MPNPKQGFDPQRFMRDPAMRLSTGHVAQLPAQLELVELTLPGNFREIAPGTAAVYDPASCTGMIYTQANQRWTMLQPIARADFDAYLAAVLRDASASGTTH